MKRLTSLSLLATFAGASALAACALGDGDAPPRESVAQTRSALVGSSFFVGDRVASTPFVGRRVLDVTYGAGEYFVTSMLFGTGAEFRVEHARVGADGSKLDPLAQNLDASDTVSSAFDGASFRVVSARATGTLDTRVVAPSGVPTGGWQTLDAKSTPAADIACANDGTCFVVWAKGAQIVGQHIDAHGAALDPAPRVLGSFGVSSGGAVPWLSVERVGASYVTFWDTYRYDPSISDTRTEVVSVPCPDGADAGSVPAPTVLMSVKGSASIDSKSTSTNGTLAVVAAGYNDGSLSTHVARIDARGAPLDATSVVITTGSPNRAQIAAFQDELLLVWGASALRLGTDGIPKDAAPIALPTAAFGADSPRVASDGAHALLVQVLSKDSWSEASLVYATEIDEAAATVAGPTLTSADALVQYAPNVVWEGEDYLTAWVDSRSTTNGIYAARVSPEGTVLDTTPATLASDPASNAARPHLASNGDGSLAVWKQARNGNQGTVLGAVVRGGAAAKSFTVQAPPFLFDDPAVASDGKQYLVAWTDTRAGTADLYTARVDGDGAVIDASGVKVLTAQPILNGILAPEVAWTGSSYVIAYLDPVGGDIFSNDVKAVWVSPDGTVLHGPVSLSDGTEAKASTIALACAPALGVCTSAWQTADAKGWTYVAYRRLDDKGALGTSTRINDTHARGPSLAWDGQGFVLGAAEVPVPDSVIVRWLAPDGRLVGPWFNTVAQGAITSDALGRVAAAPNGKTLQVWPHVLSRIQASLLGDDGIPDAGPDTGPDAAPDTGPVPPPPDAGDDASPDAGPDASPIGDDAGHDASDASDADTPTDAGPGDASAPRDAGDGGITAKDAAVDARPGVEDAGAVVEPTPSAEEGGCGCTTAGARTSSGPLGLVGAMLALVAARRRRRAF